MSSQVSLRVIDTMLVSPTRGVVNMAIVFTSLGFRQIIVLRNRLRVTIPRLFTPMFLRPAFSRRCLIVRGPVILNLVFLRTMIDVLSYLLEIAFSIARPD